MNYYVLNRVVEIIDNTRRSRGEKTLSEELYEYQDAYLNALCKSNKKKR